MSLLALVLFAPWFAILGWVFWNYPKSHAVSAERRRLDVIALLVAVAGSALAMRWSYFLPFENAGPLWPQVIATLAGYHAFLFVLLAAYLIRAKKFRIKATR
jgi:hypothetical protein